MPRILRVCKPLPPRPKSGFTVLAVPPPLLGRNPLFQHGVQQLGLGLVRGRQARLGVDDPVRDAVDTARPRGRGLVAGI